MSKVNYSAPLILLIAVLIIFAFTQWLPLLLVIPGTAAAMLVGRQHFTTGPTQNSLKTDRE